MARANFKNIRNASLKLKDLDFLQLQWQPYHRRTPATYNTSLKAPKARHIKARGKRKARRPWLSYLAPLALSFRLRQRQEAWTDQKWSEVFCLLSIGPTGGRTMIRKLKSGKYRLYSRKADAKTGKRRNLGTFDTREAAEKHERAVQYFKRRG